MLNKKAAGLKSNHAALERYFNYRETGLIDEWFKYLMLI